MILASTKLALASTEPALKRARMEHARALTDIEHGASDLAPLLTPALRRRLASVLEALDKHYDKAAPR